MDQTSKATAPASQPKPQAQPEPKPKRHRRRNEELMLTQISNCSGRILKQALADAAKEVGEAFLAGESVNRDPKAIRRDIGQRIGQVVTKALGIEGNATRGAT